MIKTNLKEKIFESGIDIGSSEIKCTIVEIDSINESVKLIGIGRSKTKGLKKGSILILPRPPIRNLLGAFSASFPFWDALGALKWRFLGGSVLTQLFKSNFDEQIRLSGD